jgi:hypothetical protein
MSWRIIKLYFKVYWRETFGDDLSTALCRGVAMLMALFATFDFLIKIYKSPYNDFGFAISLWIMAYALSNIKSDEY